MHARSAGAALKSMNEHDDHVFRTATDRFERRLAEENGKLRAEVADLRGELRAGMADLRGEVRAGVGGLRSEMIERNHELLKWALVSWAALVAAIAALMALFT